MLDLLLTKILYKQVTNTQANFQVNHKVVSAKIITLQILIACDSSFPSFSSSSLLLSSPYCRTARGDKRREQAQKHVIFVIAKYVR
jgi:hypothetical protein